MNRATAIYSRLRSSGREIFSHSKATAVWGPLKGGPTPVSADAGDANPGSADGHGAGVYESAIPSPARHGLMVVMRVLMLMFQFLTQMFVLMALRQMKP